VLLILLYYSVNHIHDALATSNHLESNISKSSNLAITEPQQKYLILNMERHSSTNNITSTINLYDGEDCITHIFPVNGYNRSQTMCTYDYGKCNSSDSIPPDIMTHFSDCDFHFKSSTDLSGQLALNLSEGTSAGVVISVTDQGGNSVPSVSINFNLIDSESEFHPIKTAYITAEKTGFNATKACYAEFKPTRSPCESWP
jgi:hypothetical protein